MEKGTIRKYQLAIAKSIIIRSYAYSLLDLSIPDHFLGIKGQLHRNTLALKLASDLEDGLITSDEAINELKKFNETFLQEDL